MVYNFNFEFWVPHLTLHFKYKYILSKNWFYIMYMMHSCPLSYKYEQLFVKDTCSKSIIFKVKNTFESSVFKWVIKTIFKRNGAHLVEKKEIWKKHLDYPFLRFECFEYAETFFDLCQNLNVKFEINGKYSKKNYDNLNYYASLVIFHT